MNNISVTTKIESSRNRPKEAKALMKPFLLIILRHIHYFICAKLLNSQNNHDLCHINKAVYGRL